MKIEAITENSELSQNVEKLLNVSDEDLRAILKHYNVSEKGLQEIVDSIKEWYEKQPHLPKGCLEDKMIVKHLILKGFSIEEVKDKIDNFISAKHKMPELLLNRDPLDPVIDEYLRFGFYAVLPKKTPKNHRVTIFRLHRSFDFVVLDVVRTACMLLEYRIRNDASLGEQWVFDLTHVSLQHSVQLTPSLLTKIVFYLRFCFGAKVKGIHFVHTPTFVGPILNILKKIMKPKIAKRINLHNNFDELHKIIPKNILPKEYDGDDLSWHEISEEWRKTIQSDAWRKYFSEQDKILSDESKRTQFLNSDDFFGCEGSFRKLEVD